tara:strand:+ start:11351 stop:12235 length:885 start_codon:yes stop_codon:yes gene_type:complete
MFEKAIENASKFTRPIHSIQRGYKGKKIIPGAATLFFVNDEGYALTCKHVIGLIANSEKINKKYSDFKTDLNKVIPQKRKATLKGLERKHKIEPNATVQIKNSFVDCVDTMTGFKWHLHSKYDLAILKFEGFNKILVNDFPRFKKDTSTIQQGSMLCRLGYPFPEFSNYKYDKINDDIVWTKNGKNSSPRFPINGMVTRFLADDKNQKIGIELSTPGLRGQSGGPLFDGDGIICGMQNRTKHLHLGFDIEGKEIQVKGKTKKVNDYSFIHLGECIHVDVIKKFLKNHNVSFLES